MSYFPINKSLFLLTRSKFINLWNCQKSLVHQKIFGPAVVYTVPVRMTTRSQVLLLNSVTYINSLDSSCSTDSITRPTQLYFTQLYSLDLFILTSLIPLTHELTSLDWPSHSHTHSTLLSLDYCKRLGRSIVTYTRVACCTCRLPRWYM